MREYQQCYLDEGTGLFAFATAKDWHSTSMLPHELKAMMWAKIAKQFWTRCAQGKWHQQPRDKSNNIKKSSDLVRHEDVQFSLLYLLCVASLHQTRYRFPPPGAVLVTQKATV
jgi:hypothetical protein